MLLKRPLKKVEHYLDIIINDISAKYSVLKLFPTTEKAGLMVTSSNNGKVGFKLFPITEEVLLFIVTCIASYNDGRN